MVQQTTQPAQPVAKQATQSAGVQPLGAQPVKKKKKWWIWVIVAVVVIAVLGGLVWFFL